MYITNYNRMNSVEQEKKYLLGIAEEQHKKIEELKKTITSAVEAQKKLQKELIETKEELDLYKEELSIAHHEYAKLKDVKNQLAKNYEWLATTGEVKEYQEETEKQLKDLREELDLYKEELKRKTDGHFSDECNCFMYPMKTAEWWEPTYNSLEEGIVGEFGDSSSQAKKYGFGVFKK